MSFLMLIRHSYGIVTGFLRKFICRLCKQDSSGQHGTLDKVSAVYFSIIIHRFSFFAKIDGIQFRGHNLFTEVCNSFTDFGSMQVQVTVETLIFAL